MNTVNDFRIFLSVILHRHPYSARIDVVAVILSVWRLFRLNMNYLLHYSSGQIRFFLATNQAYKKTGGQMVCLS